MPTQIAVERNVAVPMRDGIQLCADVYRLDETAPVPAILVRLPYDKDELLQQWNAIHPIRAAEAGYAVVFQDTRGRFRSDGEFEPYLHEAADGYDSVEWAARQPWCSGRVGMTGASYFGAAQWLAAMAQPPHLRAIVPSITGSELYEGWTYQGGSFQLGFMLFWTLVLAADTTQRLVKAGQAGADEAARLLATQDRIQELYRFRPLNELPALRTGAAARGGRHYFEWLAHPADDAFWQNVAVNRHYPQVHVPAFNVGGWYDIFLGGTLENYTRMRVEGGTPQARAGQRLLIGPWAHGNYSGEYADRSFGAASSFDSIDIHMLKLRYFDHTLKGLDNGVEEEPPVRIFVMGEDRWRSEADWPLPDTRYVPWYIHSEGQAGARGGTLSENPPTEEPPDVYVYDPRQPVPTLGGQTLLPGMYLSLNAGPRDQRAAEARPDVLAYTSETLAEPVEVTGPIAFNLWAASSAPDTDFVVRLCDVHPDGASLILVEGILRTRFRDGFEHPSLVVPGQVLQYRINLLATSNLFLAGHRIRVDITSSSWPRFDPNPNTGHAIGTDGPDDLVPALQTILHDADHPSHVVLPLIAR